MGRSDLSDGARQRRAVRAVFLDAGGTLIHLDRALIRRGADSTADCRRTRGIAGSPDRQAAA